MRSHRPRNRVVRTFLRLLRCEQGNDALSAVLLTTLGLAAVDLAMPYVFESGKMGGEALKHQAGVLARGADTGAVQGMSGANNGFDIGAATGIMGSVADFGSRLGAAAAASAAERDQGQSQAQGPQGQAPASDPAVIAK